MILKHLYSEAIQWEWESVEIEIEIKSWAFSASFLLDYKDREYLFTVFGITRIVYTSFQVK